MIYIAFYSIFLYFGYRGTDLKSSTNSGYHKRNNSKLVILQLGRNIISEFSGSSFSLAENVESLLQSLASMCD